MPEKISQGDLLYHSVHGLCRVKEVLNQNQADKKSYAIVPKLTSLAKVRFVVSAEDVKASGFHSPVSLAEANQILEYLKTGEKTAKENETWSLAETILSFSHDKSEARDQRKRQILARSARGLIGELAFVLEITVQEVVAKMRKSLTRSSKINPLVLTALTNAIED